jgi:hypothetical protein
VTEIVEDDAGRPYLFVAKRAELRQAIDAIPAETLLRANRVQWTSRGLDPPKMTAAGLRKKLLAKHERAASQPDDLVLPIEEAARHLGLTGRVLRYRIQQGEFDGHTRSLLGGQTGLVFAPRARHWSLAVERPDPRIVMQMVRDRVQPGQQHHPGYTRHTGGENWREASRW